MKNSNVKQIIAAIADLRKDTAEYVNAYISFVENKIPAGMESCFGVGIARKHPRWGTVYGFENGGDFTVVGEGYYYASDYNYWVNGSTSKEVKDFAKRIPLYMKSGIEALEAEELELASMLKNKIDFESLLK
ncbi:hypothetical protein GOQ04_03435 [Emticicia sp. ODNR4P]|nr:hypothetical protein [Emticicia sp. ODNR4P]